MIKCVKCSQQLPDDANFCYKCGFPVGKVEISRTCPDCGGMISAIDKFCSNCGRPVTPVKVSREGTDLAQISQHVSQVQNGNTPKLVDVYGDQFIMGSGKNTCIITLSNFKMAEALVTQKQYLTVMGQNPSKLKGDAHPVESVNWCEALIYCNRLSIINNLMPCYSIGAVTDLSSFEFSSPVWKRITCNFQANGFRLPTEAEWEFAAKGGAKMEKFQFAGSDNISEVAWYGENSDITTHDVGSKKPNSLGLYDMCGNVSEWCWDYFVNDLPTGTATDPHGPNFGNAHVKRGGSWLDDPQQCTIAFRSGSAPNGKSSSLGFRVCQTMFEV